MIANDKKHSLKIFLAEPSLGAHTVPGHAFRLRTPLFSFITYHANS